MAKTSKPPPPVSETKADEPARTPAAPEPAPIPAHKPGCLPVSLKQARALAAKR